MMKNARSLVLATMIIMVCLSACSSLSRQLDDNAFADIPLPFDDGSFIIDPPSSGGNGSLDSFTFGGIQELYTRGTIWTSYYIAVNFDVYAADFNDIMNSITPVLVDAVTICTVSTDNWLRNPFRLLAREDSLYFWARNDFYNQGIGIRLTIYQLNGYGYLFFSLSFWDYEEPHGRSRVEDSIHHSLYIISPDDLARFSEFAEKLIRGREEFHGHTFFTRSFRRGVTIVGIVGILVAILGIAILKHGSATPIADFSALSEEERNKHDSVLLRRYYAKTIIIPIGLLVAICGFYWRFYYEGLMLARVPFDSLYWVTGACIVISVGLVIFAIVYRKISKCFRI